MYFMDNIFSNTFTNGIYSHSKPQNISVHKQEKYKNHSYTANASGNNFSCFVADTPKYVKKKSICLTKRSTIYIILSITIAFVCTFILRNFYLMIEITVFFSFLGAQTFSLIFFYAM